MLINTKSQTKSRLWSYAALFIGLTLVYIFLRGVSWQGSTQLHTLMETVATLLALMVGIMALGRFYARKNNTFLFIGTGFVGTALLDGYHAVVTSSLFASSFPSAPASLIPWSWVASRWFLSILITISWLAWYREHRRGTAGIVSERTVYLFVGLLTFCSFLFFALVPLPRAYYPEYVFHRPEEFVPAIFFLIALVGYLRKGWWKTDSFEHWLVLSLIVGFVGQAIFMSFSGQLFDLEFDAAHLLKKVSYVLVLAGLIISMYHLFKQEEAQTHQLASEIAERQQAEDDLRSSEAKERALLNAIPDAMWRISREGTLLDYKPARDGKTNIAPEQVIGQKVQEVLPPEVAGQWADSADRARQSAEIQFFEFQNTHDGLAADYEVRIVASGDDELVAIVRNVTDRRAVERMKNEFVSIVSHELRTPLTSIRGALGLLGGGAVGPLTEKAQYLVDIAVSNTDRLVRLINDILDLERVEAGRAIMEKRRCDIGDLIKQSVEGLQILAKSTGVNLVMSSPSAEVDVDSDRIIQTLTNLISNAIKFSPQGSTVSVGALSQGNEVVVQIQDQGRGIPGEQLETIFERFQQVDGSDSREKGGTGLGLAICRSIVNQHDGRIWAESKLGEGSVFYFTLPMSTKSAPCTQEVSHVSQASFVD